MTSLSCSVFITNAQFPQRIRLSDYWNAIYPRLYACSCYVCRQTLNFRRFYKLFSASYWLIPPVSYKLISVTRIGLFRLALSTKRWNHIRLVHTASAMQHRAFESRGYLPGKKTGQEVFPQFCIWKSFSTASVRRILALPIHMILRNGPTSSKLITLGFIICQSGQ